VLQRRLKPPREGPMQLACSSTNEAAPPFAVFERWAPQASSFVLIRRSSDVDYREEPKFTIAKSPDTIVPGTHPSKIAKGGAASILVVQRWASPPAPTRRPRIRVNKIRLVIPSNARDLGFASARPARVGRTLLSDALDVGFDFDFYREWHGLSRAAKRPTTDHCSTVEERRFSAA
jgi:hypothetical protein